MNLSYLRPLYEEQGPWTSVYLDASRDGENADHAVDLRWRSARERLSDADPATLDEIGTAIAADPGPPARHGLAIFAANGRVRLTETLAEPPGSVIAAHAPLPHAMPLVVARGEDIPWVRILADRTGGDRAAVAAGGLARRTTVTGGGTHPITKSRPGGRHQPHFHRAAEASWARNAGDVAAAGAHLAELVGAEVIIIAGDVHAVQLVAERLPRRWHDRIVRRPGGARTEGGTPAGLDDETARAVGELVAARTREAIDRYGVQRGGDAAAIGMAAAVAALQRGQLDRLLLVNVPNSTHELWIGPAPEHLAVDREQLREMGVESPVRVRADAALLRAICRTDAELVLVDPHEVTLHHGVGAVLRYADAGTRRR